MDHRESRKTAAEGARRGRRGDLTALAIPIIAINGSFDAPYAKTHRFWREAHVFENIILSEKTYLTAIAVGGPMPAQYADATSRFIDAYVQP